MVIANRVPCQTSVLPRILKRHIGQVENLQLFIRSIYSRSLEKQGQIERQKDRCVNHNPWEKSRHYTGRKIWTSQPITSNPEIPQSCIWGDDLEAK